MKIKTSIMLISTIVYMAFAINDTWVTTGRDQAYPNEMYFVGVGLSERGADAAKQNAIVEIKKQISVKVNASMLDEQTSLTSGGKEVATNRIESRARLVTGGDVQGVEIVKTATQGGIAYALAILDKKNFATNTKTKIAELKEQLAKNIEGATADIASAKVGAALDKLSDAKKLINQIVDLRTMLSAAAEITAAEKLNYSFADIAALYEKCISSVRMTKVSGDAQVFAVGMVPSDPFVVTIKTTDGTAVPMIPVVLLDGSKKIADKYTDDAGKAEFMMGEKADMSAGSHSYTATIALQVSSASKKYLNSQNQTFSYTVQSNPCFAKIAVEVTGDLASGRADIGKKVIARLAKYDIKNDPQAENSITVTVGAKEVGGVSGLSESNSFIKTEVTLGIVLLDDDGKEVASITGTAKGMGGSVVKSAAQGIDNVKIDKDIKIILEKLCNAKAAGPKLKIAVFEFKNRGYYAYWYDMAIDLSDMIITKLINSGKFDVVERSQLERIMEEKALAQSGVVEEKEAVAVAQLAGADIILIGSANALSGKIEADARIVDIKTGIAKCAMSSSSYSITDLRALADDLVGQIKNKCAK